MVQSVLVGRLGGAGVALTALLASMPSLWSAMSAMATEGPALAFTGLLTHGLLGAVAWRQSVTHSLAVHAALAAAAAVVRSLVA